MPGALSQAYAFCAPFPHVFLVCLNQSKSWPTTYRGFAWRPTRARKKNAAGADQPADDNPRQEVACVAVPQALRAPIHRHRKRKHTRFRCLFVFFTCFLFAASPSTSRRFWFHSLSSSLRPKFLKSRSIAHGIRPTQISMERDDLVEENEKCAARLDQLTAALQDQREEKSRLANQVRPFFSVERRHRPSSRQFLHPSAHTRTPFRLYSLLSSPWPHDATKCLFVSRERALCYGTVTPSNLTRDGLQFGGLVISGYTPPPPPRCSVSALYDARVYGHTTTAIHDNETHPRPSNVCLVGENRTCSVPAL